MTNAFGLDVSPIRLPKSRRIPQFVSGRDERPENLYNAMNALAIVPNLLPVSDPPSVEIFPAEVERAKMAWLLCHHAIFCLFALIGHGYRMMYEGADPAVWGPRIAGMWRGTGACIGFGSDFYPTVPIYQSAIRAVMPEAFSGFWMGERQELTPLMAAFQERVAGSPDDVALARAMNCINDAHAAYREYHKLVMRIAAPGEISLLQRYKERHGHAHPIGDDEARISDEHFGVVRADVGWSDYAEEWSDLIVRIVRRMEMCHRLPGNTLVDLADGFRAGCEILSEPFGTANHF